MYDENKWNDTNRVNGELSEEAGRPGFNQQPAGQMQGAGRQPETEGGEGRQNQNLSWGQEQAPEGRADGYQNPSGTGSQPGGYQGTSPVNRQPEGYRSAAGPVNQQAGQSRGPYSSPYPYQSSGYQGQPGGGSPYSGGAQPAGGQKPPKKKKPFLRTAAMITAAAVLFGGVSGVTMFGVNRAAEILAPDAAKTPENLIGQSETITQQTEASTAVAQEDGGVVTGVVIEDVSPIVDAAMPSVVAITNTMLYQSNSWFGPSQPIEVPSSGSGIIVGQNDTELLIVTNNHVIEDSDSLKVTFIDESTVDAAVKGTDSESDLAVIAIPLDQISADTKSQIKTATLGDSDAMKMGQGVIAIGNALGLGQSVTVGHVSAVNREISVNGQTKTVIQTDAAINPGNSGGALLNSKGEVIGINEAKYADTNVEGVGYAIPISNAKDIIEDLKARSTKIEVAEEDQGYLGIQVQNIDSAVSKMYGMPQGVYVYKIMEDSAAAGSDLREKDIITKFDGETVRSNADLTQLLTYYKAGTTVTMTVQSLEDGAYVERQVEVTLKERPKEQTEVRQK